MIYRFFVITALVASGLAGCTNPHSIPSGVYEGTDGAVQTPKTLKLTVASLSDGYLTALWESDGVVREGQVFGHIGWFEDTISMRATQGDCKGEFHGRMKVQRFSDGVHLTGDLDENPSCPDERYRFDLVAEHDSN